MTAQKSQKGLLRKSQKAQKGQKGRKTNFKSRRRGRRAATPARLLPALRQTARLGCGVSPCFQGVGQGQTARRPWCCLAAVVQAWTLCAPLRAFCPSWYKYAPHGLRPSWAALRGCDGIQANRHKRTPAGYEPVRGFVRYNQRKRGRLWRFQ